MKVSIVGATGYSGLELLRLVSQHPNLELISLHSLTGKGELLSETFPLVKETGYDLIVEPVDAVRISAIAEIVFLATPAGIAKDLIPLLSSSLQIIDLSGDFRLEKSENYDNWYGQSAAAQALRDEAIYGLSEWEQTALMGARLIANPGCYATAILLALMPLFEKLAMGDVIIDAKSGVSGAGKGLSPATHFMQTHDNLQAYKINRHQHIPEIEQQLSKVTESVAPITLTTQLLPIARGLMATIYFETSATNQQLSAIFATAYQQAPFVRIFAEQLPTIQQVIGSNYCDIGWHKDERTGRVTLISVIDNLVKGAAGQAIQNVNISQGWEQTLGLPLLPILI
ncbi:N-acetyl-gamma-glutamyl-phosphate reductase [Brochothrix campestris]|uniref:N-acetyl-gamma-glutamyl-phosphate reductase n=1 Tax=Brochothrix campestris FSL F6-1037 TaxID=1265861 RepID=W7D1K9_9LIST|nr:N-acetyl-gamma-glutamyl-phosphate reductase [Brochothrix campestris]EUJ41796.1 N-acetyl-gamma-glutamyl-phosphate reductase [Brochothrix campestris FSL F6-1037]